MNKTIVRSNWTFKAGLCLALFWIVDAWAGDPIETARFLAGKPCPSCD